MYIAFASIVIFACNLNLSQPLEVAVNVRHVARCPITLSSTCNLILCRGEGSASLSPGVIYDWGHVNKIIWTIWALQGKIPDCYVHHARQAHAGNHLFGDIMLLWTPGCRAPEQNMQLLFFWFWWWWWWGTVLTQGDICVNMGFLHTTHYLKGEAPC